MHSPDVPLSWQASALNARIVTASPAPHTHLSRLVRFFSDV